MTKRKTASKPVDKPRILVMHGPNLNLAGPGNLLNADGRHLLSISFRVFPNWKCPRKRRRGAPSSKSARRHIVKAGDTLCIIEAMKLMNEIEADVPAWSRPSRSRTARPWSTDSRCS
jgi:hypothetical protein